MQIWTITSVIFQGHANDAEMNENKTGKIRDPKGPTMTSSLSQRKKGDFCTKITNHGSNCQDYV